jgi:hypothetical protein
VSSARMRNQTSARAIRNEGRKSKMVVDTDGVVRGVHGTAERGRKARESRDDARGRPRAHLSGGSSGARSSGTGRRRTRSPARRRARTRRARRPRRSRPRRRAGGPRRRRTGPHRPSDRPAPRTRRSAARAARSRRTRGRGRRPSSRRTPTSRRSSGRVTARVRRGSVRSATCRARCFEISALIHDLSSASSRMALVARGTPRFRVGARLKKPR